MSKYFLFRRNLFLLVFLLGGIIFTPKVFAISLFNVCAPNVTCLTKVDTIGSTSAKLIPSYLIQTDHSQEYYQSASWWFEYGANSSFSNSLTTNHNSGSLANGMIISGLTGNTKYYARLVVSSSPSGLQPLNFKSEAISFTTSASGEVDPTPINSDTPNISVTPTPGTDTDPVLVVDENPAVTANSRSGGASGGGGSGSKGGGGGSATVPVKKIFTVAAGRAFKISIKPVDIKVKKVTIAVFGKTYPMIGRKGIYTGTIKAPTKLGKYSYVVRFIYPKKTVVKKDILQVIKPLVKKPVVVKVVAKTPLPKPTVTPVKKVLGTMDIEQPINKPWYQKISDAIVGFYHLMPWTY